MGDVGYKGDIGENKSIGKFIVFCLMSLSVFINKKAKFDKYILELFKEKNIMPELIIHFIL